MKKSFRLLTILMVLLAAFAFSACEGGAMDSLWDDDRDNNDGNTPVIYYTLTYNANGADSGTAPADPNSPYEAGSTVTVLGNTGSLVKAHTNFAGWNGKSDGSGNNYVAGSTFTINADTVLYALFSNKNPSPAAPSLTDTNVTAPTTTTSNDGQISGVTTAMEYSTDGGNTWHAVTGDPLTGLSAGYVDVRLAETEDTLASLSVTLDVRADGPAAPAGLGTAGSMGSDGKITNLDSGKSYQYSTSASGPWTDIASGSTEKTGLVAGTYYVREKVDSTKQKDGSNVSVTVAALGGGGFVPGIPVTVTLDYTDAGNYDPSVYYKSITVKTGDASLTIGPVPTLAHCDMKGFYVDSALTTKVANADGTLLANVSGYTDSSGKWTKASNCTLYAKWLLVGALSGEFSVSSTKTVHFSKGNLWYDGTSAWSFETNQYDSTPASDGTYSASHVSHFFWETTGNYGSGASCVTSSGTASDVVDWGVKYCEANSLAASTWRTLTTGEWQYLLSTRGTGDTYFKRGVTVCGKTNCLVIAPDGNSTAIASSYDATAWATAEANGFVCLPAAGERDGSSVENVGNNGNYWSSSAYAYDGGFAYGVSFHGSNVDPANYYMRNYGHSVRLVCEE